MNEQNFKIKFSCSKCGAEASAPQDTQRANKNLCKDCFGKREDRRSNELNDLSGREWALLSKSVEYYNGVRSDKQKLIGAAFPLSLVESHIKIYTKSGQLVFDPFLGVGTTIQAAEALGRKSVGIELDTDFVRLAKKDIQNKKDHIVICDDVRNLKRHVQPNSVDFQITSPPYANLLKTVKGSFAYKWREHSSLNVADNPRPYSSDKRDLGNLDYDGFLSVVCNVFKDTYDVLKQDCYAAWVVKDYRDLKGNKPYVCFHMDLVQCAKEAGLTLWDIRIYDQTRFRPLVVLGYPSRNYYLNIGHSYILIFKKMVNSYKKASWGEKSNLK
jgi:DNA modification methylase